MLTRWTERQADDSVLLNGRQNRFIVLPVLAAHRHLFQWANTRKNRYVQRTLDTRYTQLYKIGETIQVPRRRTLPIETIGLLQSMKL